MNITFIRHGMTEGNHKKRYIGSTDESLYDTKCLMRAYPDCDIVICSPMKRCIETAEFIYPQKERIICDKLRECDFGDFENKSYNELISDSRYQEWIDSNGYAPFPNGEDRKAFSQRCIDGFYQTLPRDCGSVSYVVHGGTIMAIMSHLFGGDFYDYQIKNGEYIQLVL